MRVLVLLSALVTTGSAMAQESDSAPSVEQAPEESASEESASEEPPTEESPTEESPTQEAASEEAQADPEIEAPAGPAEETDIFSQDVLSTEEEEEETDPVIPTVDDAPALLSTPDQPVSERQLRGFSPSLNAHEMPESAHTVGAGKYQVHLGLGQSSMGLSDNLDLRTRIVGQFFGFNAQLKWALVQEESKALSIEPGVWAEWPWAKMGFPSYSLGTMIRNSHRVADKSRLHLGVGAYYDVLKVTLQFSDDYVAGQGFGGDWYYSLTMTRAPLVFGHQVEDISDGDTNPGWKFSGVRVPVVLGYEYLSSDRSSFNTVLRVHPMNYLNGGGWYAELHPTYVTRMGDNARIVLGVNLVMPGNPIPIADDALTERVEKEQSNLHIRGWEDWFPKLPVAPIPYLGVYWVF